MGDIITAPFDYSVIDQDARDDVRDAAMRIKVRMARTAADIIDIGNDLIAVKAALGHGRFLAWIDAEFGMTERTAQNFMQVGERFRDKSETVSDFTVSALYALAAPSTPADIVMEVTERAAKGEAFTAADIKAMKAEWASERDVLKTKAARSDAIKQDFEQQLADLQDKLATVRDEAETLRFEAARAQAAPANPAPGAPHQQTLVLSQANAIIGAWNRACPEAREIAMDQMDGGPVFDRTRAA
jgi:hypothetical protein